jgi:hypothetical protein
MSKFSLQLTENCGRWNVTGYGAQMIVYVTDKGNALILEEPVILQIL